MPPMSPPTGRFARTARKLPSAAAALTLALTTAACGGDGSPAPEGADRSADSAPASPGAADFPVTIEHVHGVTQIREEPRRVVTVGLADQDAALALGVRPVGVVDWLGERPYGTWPWTKELWGDTRPVIVGEREDFDYEEIIELRPDLILGLYTGIDEEKYRTLSKIAPTVAWNGDHPPYGTPWQDMTRTAGRALGKEAEADRLIEDVDRKFAAVRTRHPEFARQTALVADTYQPGEYSGFAPHDPKSVFVKELGFELSEPIADLAGEENAATVGSERLDLFDVDRLIWLNWDATSQKRIEADDVYRQLRVAKEGRDVFLSYFDPPVGAAITYNTVLSIPYAIDQTVPLLAD